LRRLPFEIARGLDLDQLSTRDFFALADVDLPAADVEEGLEPGLPIAVNRPLTLPSPPVGERDLRSDGAEGLGALKAAGAITIAQDEQSCVVFGMPKVAIEKGYAQRVVSLDMMANTLLAQCAVDRRSLAKV